MNRLPFRACSNLACVAPALFIGSYERPNGEKCTLAACSVPCVAALDVESAAMDRKVVWGPRLGVEVEDPAGATAPEPLKFNPQETA